MKKAGRRLQFPRWHSLLVVGALVVTSGLAPSPVPAAQRFSTVSGGVWANAGTWEIAVPVDDAVTDLARIRDGATVVVDAPCSVGAIMVGTGGQPGSGELHIAADLNIGTLDIWNGVSFYGGDGDSSSSTVQAGGTTVTIGGKMSVAPDAAGTGTYAIGPGATLTANNGVWIGHNADATLGGTGNITVDGGTLIINSNALLVNNGALIVTNGGAVQASSANVWLHVGFEGGSASFVMDSGTVSITNQFMVGAHGVGTGLQGGGDLRVDGVFFVGGFNDNLTAGTGTYTQVGGTVSASGYPGLGALNFNGAGKNAGIYNLNGGTLLVGAAGGAGIKMGGGVGQGFFNFNGGVLKAADSNTTFMTGLTAATLLDGGGTIDDGGFAVTLGQTLGGRGALVKTGTGTVTLTSGASTCSGTVTVAQGTLVAAGATGFFNPGAGSLGNPQAAQMVEILSGATLRLAANDVWGNANSTPNTRVVLRGLMENTAVYNTMVDLTLIGGELRANGGASAAYPAYQLKGTVTVTGSAPSRITATTLYGTRNGIHLGSNVAASVTTFSVADVTGDTNVDLAVSATLQNGKDVGGAVIACGLVKTGDGAMRSTAINSFSGASVVSNGILSAGAAGVANAGLFVPWGSGVTVETGATLVATAAGAIYGYLNGAAWVAPTVNKGLMDVAGAGNVNMGPIVLAGGEMRATGPGDSYGTWNLNNDVLVTADSTISAANVNPGGNSLGPGGQRKFTVNAGATLTFSGFIRNGGNNSATSMGIIKDGDGTLLLSGSNTYSGATTVSGGVLAVGHAMAFGTGPLIMAGGLLTASGGARTFANTVRMDADSTVDTAAGDLTFAGPLTNGATLVKQGAGLLTMAGSGAYTGTVIVSDGTLVINGALGTDSVILVSSGTLAGSGSAGIVTNAGTVAPGAGGVESLTLAAFQSLPGSTVSVELAGATVPGTDHDQLIVTGNAALDGTLNVTTNGYVPVDGDAFTVLIAGSFTGSFAATNLPPLAPGLHWNVQYSPSTVMLVVTQAPALTGYNLWAQSITNEALRGYDADADGDGYANLLEYSQGTDPTNGADRARVQLVKTGAVYALKFNYVPSAVDLVYHVEASYALTNSTGWEGIKSNCLGQGWTGDTTVTWTNDGPVIQIFAEDNDPYAPRRGMRLRIERP